jgi:hypothetical protein
VGFSDKPGVLQPEDVVLIAMASPISDPEKTNLLKVQKLDSEQINF